MEQACIDGDLAYITANATEVDMQHVIDCCSRGQIDVIKHIKTVAERPVSSALFHACSKQMCDVVDILAPLKPKLIDPFAMVCINGNTYIFDALIQAGYNVNACGNYYHPIIIASSKNHINIIHRLYIHGAKMNVIQLEDNAITHSAYKDEFSIDTLKVLIDYGVSLFINGTHIYNKCGPKNQAYMIEAGLYTK